MSDTPEMEFPATSTDPEASKPLVKEPLKDEANVHEEESLDAKQQIGQRRLSHFETPSEPVKASKPKKNTGGTPKKRKKAKKEPMLEQTDVELTSSLGSIPKLDVEAEFKGKMPMSESSGTSKLTPLESVSVHSEDSSSSRDDATKKESSADILQDGYNLQENHEFCLTAIENNPDIPMDLRLPIQTLLQKYQEAVEKNIKGKEKAETELENTTKKMIKDLQRATELQDEVNTLKKKLDNTETNVKCLEKELDESYEREHDLIDELKLVNKKVEHLNNELEKKQLEDQLRDQGLDITSKSRESFTKEITRLKQDLELSDSRLHLSLKDFEELLKKYKEKEAECNEMEEMLKSNKYEVLKEMQKSKILEADLERVSEDMRNLKLTVAKHYKTFKNASQELMKKDEEVFELRKNSRLVNQQNEAMAKLISELKERLETCSKKYFEVEAEYKKLKEVCSNQTGDLNIIAKKSIDLEKSQDRWLNRVISSERKRRKAVQDAKRLFSQMKEMSYEAKKSRISMIKLNRTISGFKKENNLLSKQVKSLQVVIDEQKKQADDRNQLIYQLNEESNRLKTENLTQQKALTKYFKIKEKEMKEKVIQDEIHAKVEENLSECSLENSRLRKEMEDKAVQLKQMENMYHTAATEKKYTFKRLLDAQGQIRDLQNKSKFIFQEMELVKEQLNKKQQDYEKLQTSNRKDVFTKDTMTFKLDNCIESRKNLLKTIEERDMEIKQQIDIIIKKETNIKEMQLEIETLKRQIGDLKTVIQKRNAELSLVYEKSELMKYILSNGEEQYQQRLKDIELLKREIRKLRADKKLLIGLAENTPDLRFEMFHLHKDLSKERQKCRALEEQMENPLNIHRWRLLEV